MHDFIAALPQMIVSGLAIGGLYALVAQGFYITYAATRTFNFAQGDFVALGAIVAVIFVVGLPVRIPGVTGSFIHVPSIPLVAAAALAVLVVALLGLLTERVAIAPLKSFAQHSWFISTAAMSLIIVNVLELTYGREAQPFPPPFGTDVIQIGPAGVLPQEAFVFVASLVAMGLLFVFLERSRLGRALRAVAFDRDAAELVGIDARAMAVVAYGLAAAMAGLAGVLVGPITSASVYMGLALLVRAFIAAIIGGLDNPQGILVGGLVLGIGEKVLAFTISMWAEAALLFLVIVFLGVRPYGLLGRRPVEKV